MMPVFGFGVWREARAHWAFLTEMVINRYTSIRHHLCHKSNVPVPSALSGAGLRLCLFLLLCYIPALSVLFPSISKAILQ